MDTPTPPAPQDVHIAQRDIELAKVLERIAQLERRLGLDSSNSSKAPSSDSSKSRAQRRTLKPSGKAQGGQPSHDGAHRSVLDASKCDHFISHLLIACQRCGLELAETCFDGAPLGEQTFELPALTPTTTEHRSLACPYKGCGKTTRVASTLAPSASRYGPNLLGLIGHLNVPMNTTSRNTLAFVREYLALPASLGGIQASLQALSSALEPLGHQARAECERAIRPGVIKRKISFGTQSEADKKLMELSWTVSQTCKKLGLAVSSIYAQAIAAFQAGLPTPPLA